MADAWHCAPILLWGACQDRPVRSRPARPRPWHLWGQQAVYPLTAPCARSEGLSVMHKPLPGAVRTPGCTLPEADPTVRVSAGCQRLVRVRLRGVCSSPTSYTLPRGSHAELREGGAHLLWRPLWKGGPHEQLLGVRCPFYCRCSPPALPVGAVPGWVVVPGPCSSTVWQAARCFGNTAEVKGGSRSL